MLGSASRPLSSPAPFIICALLLGTRLVSSQACFNIQGDQTNALPCNSGDEHGPCCTPGWICLSNGLCRPGPDSINNGLTEFYRPDCTDATWNISACFTGCNEFGGNGLTLCGKGEFCCFDYDSCDCESTNLFSLGAASFVTTLPLTPTPSSSAPVSTTASTTSVHSTPSASPSSSPSSIVSSSLPTSNGAPVTEEPEANSSNRETAIGAGLGVGLGIPLIAVSGVLAYVLLRRRKHDSQRYGAHGEGKASELGTMAPRVENAPYYQLPAGSLGFTSERHTHAVGTVPQEMDANDRR